MCRLTVGTSYLDRDQEPNEKPAVVPSGLAFVFAAADSFASLTITRGVVHALRTTTVSVSVILPPSVIEASS